MTETRDWLHPPKQDRSQETTDRILAAAVQMFAEERFETVAVGDLAACAGVSVGGFYARFKNKDALMHAVDEHLVDEMLRVVRRAMDEDRLRGANLAGVVETYVRTMVGFLVRHRSLARQVTVRARTTEDAGFVARMQAFNAEAHGLFSRRLLERGDEIRCADPERSIEFAIMMISAGAREAVLFGERKMNLSTVRGRALVEALVRAFLAYLGAANALEWTATGTEKRRR